MFQKKDGRCCGDATRCFRHLPLLSFCQSTRGSPCLHLQVMLLVLFSKKRELNIGQLWWTSPFFFGQKSVRRYTHFIFIYKKKHTGTATFTVHSWRPYCLTPKFFFMQNQHIILSYANARQSGRDECLTAAATKTCTHHACRSGRDRGRLVAR